MARQDFLDGGFIGKVGEVVGQRRNNTRYVRTYVVPANPNTPKQIATRQGFATAIRLTQEAMLLNKGAPCWQSERMGEYPRRVSVARNRLLAGLSEAEALPLYPDGYTDYQAVTGLTVSWSGTPDTVALASSGPVFETERTFFYNIYYFTRASAQWERTTGKLTIPAGGTFSAVLPWTAEQSYPEGAWIEGATLDDGTPDSLSISLPRTALTEPHPGYYNFDMKFVPTEWDQQNHKVYFACEGTYPPVSFTGYIDIYTYSYETSAWAWKHIYMAMVDGVVQPFSAAWDTTHAYPQGASVKEFSRTLNAPYWFKYKIVKHSFKQPTVPGQNLVDNTNDKD